MGRSTQNHVETAKAAPSNLTLRENPECYFYSGKIFLEEGFVTPQMVSAAYLAPSLL